MDTVCFLAVRVFSRLIFIHRFLLHTRAHMECDDGPNFGMAKTEAKKSDVSSLLSYKY